MNKYIAGFRGGKKFNKIVGSIYYALILLTIIFASGGKIDNISAFIFIGIFPSFVLNFITMFFKWKTKKEYRKIFGKTSLVLIAIFILFIATAEVDKTNINSSVASNESKIEKLKDKKKGTDEVKKVAFVKENVKESELHFINTGNSDTILIKQGDKAALIDGGDNDDEKLLVSYLKKQAVNELEYVFATHPHADHIGGLDAVVDNIPVKNILVSNGDANTKTYRDFIYSMSNKGLSPSVPLLNSEFKLGTSTFKVVSVANMNNPNNDSIVLEYTNGDDKVLLMGDAEKEIEEKINVGKVDLLKVGHHGSSTSSNKAFIDKVNPEHAVILVVKDNSYGHPHVETMDTLKNKDIKVHRSDECGDIVFKSSGKGITTNCKLGSFNAGKKIEDSEPKQVKDDLNNEGNGANNNNIGSSNSSVNSSNNNDNANNNINNKAANNNYSTSSTPDYKPDESSDLEVGEVYWVANGKVYHYSSGCSTLSRSKNIRSGSISESGKARACKVCG